MCCRYSFELYRQADAIQMGTHNIYLYKEVDKMFTDCALIGVCVEIRSNTVFIQLHPSVKWFDISGT